MAKATILVGNLGKHPVSSTAFASALQTAWDATDAKVDIRPCLSIYELEGALPKAQGAILLGGELEEDADFASLLSALESAGIPTITLLKEKTVLRRKFAFVGSMTEPLDIEPASIVALLKGMMHRQAEIARLRTDVHIAEKFHTGLQNQMALIHEELQLAAMVQREHLPRELPCIHGVDVGVMYRPANYVSGDIYDIMRLDEDHIGVFLADAVGHGVPAALLTMIISKSLHTKEINGSNYRLVDPSEVLERLNTEMIKRKGDSTRFATAVYALINCRTRIARIAGAGHPPPFIFSTNGDTRSIASEGGLLGVFPEETYPSTEVELRADDVMVFYSDGFEQAFPESDEEALGRLPTERYLSVFAKYAEGAPPQDQMVSAVAEMVESQPGSLHQIDDLTLIGVRSARLGQPEDDVAPTSAEATACGSPTPTA